ncbi:MAG: homoserine dehydrogenase [Candidatus Margulisiibacteriota bacterium]
MKTSLSHPSLINIGIVGCGNIGSAAAEAIRKNHAVVLANTGLDLKIKGVCDVRKVKTSFPLTHDPMDLINDPEISVIVEAMGGVNPALKYILAALNAGKHVVTPNKEVVAKHLPEMLAAARKNGVQILFEGAVGGGIPILQSLRQSLAGNSISEIYGIVNGTTNYILSKMLDAGMEFSEALERAQTKGYAEPNPTNDIDGFDAMYKAVILAEVAFGVQVDWKTIPCEGIRGISQEDIQYAGEIGYVIKLLATAKKVKDGLDVRVHPTLVPKSHPLASVACNYNAIYVKGEPVGDLMFYGQGAGGGPTASAIMGDIIEAVNDKCPTCLPAGKVTNDKLRKIILSKNGEIQSRYYIRLQVPDRCGVLAEISKAFARKRVSIAAVMQKETVGNLATIVILVDKAAEKDFSSAIAIIKKLAVVHRVCSVIRIM